MSRTRVELRLPSDLVDQVRAEAERLGQTRTTFIERALRLALGVVEDQEPRVPQQFDRVNADTAPDGSLRRVEKAREVPLDESYTEGPQPVRFHCRQPSCDFSAPSPNAKCRHHGGKLVER